MQTQTTFTETCRRCGGTGTHWATHRENGRCFACEGIGTVARKTSPEARQRARTARRSRVERVRQEGADAFIAAQPAAWAWIEAAAERFPFAASMRDTVQRRGELSDNQLAAVERCMARDAERNAAREVERAAQAERAAHAPTVDASALMRAFDAARASGLRRPKMRFEGFEASLAPANGRNAGAIYVKDGEAYLGKIADGRFIASRECSDAQAEGVAQTMTDPLAAAVAYGRRTGNCSCCGRGLTDPRSVEMGIGPICAGKFLL